MGTWTTRTPRVQVAASEAGQVGDRSPADADDGVRAGQPEPAELLPEPGGDLGGLGRLAVGDDDGLGGDARPSAASPPRRRPAAASGGACTTAAFAVPASTSAELGLRARADDAPRRAARPATVTRLIGRVRGAGQRGAATSATTSSGARPPVGTVSVATSP